MGRLGGAAGGSGLTRTVAMGSTRRVSAISGPGGACIRALRGFFLSLSLALAAERKSLRLSARLTLTSLVSPPALVTLSRSSAPAGCGAAARPGCETSASPSRPPPAGCLRSSRSARRSTFSLRSRSFSARRASFTRALARRASSSESSPSPPSSPPSPRRDFFSRFRSRLASRSRAFPEPSSSSRDRR